MKSVIIVLTLCVSAHLAFSQSTAFTYQGRLNEGASPVTGSFDLRFTVYDALTGGSAVSGAITNGAAAVSSGHFTVTLDFGANVFTGADRWLEIAVRTNGASSFATLAPRQPISSTPYAITAGNVTGPLSANALSGVYSNAVTFSNAANQFAGTFTGNGGGLSNVNAQTLGGLSSSAFWKLTGNNVAPGQFLGSTNNQPVEIRVNGQRAMRYEPTTNAPNLIGGWTSNYVQTGLEGVTIGGGGSAALFNGNLQPNVVTNNGSYATIAGGYNNTVEGYGGVVAGGSVNAVVGSFGLIGGGQFHRVDRDAFYSVIGGGFINIIETNAQGAFLGGGSVNTIRHDTFVSSIVGGYGNTNGASYGAIGGGVFNRIATNNSAATIAGGERNAIRENAYWGFIGGGLANVIHPGSGFSAIGAGQENSIESNAGFSVIGGGVQNAISGISGGSAFVGGGTGNTNSGGGGFIGAGFHNRAEHFDAVVVGGAFNANSSFRGFIGAGENNSNASPHSFIGAGYQNVLEPFTDLSVIGGGLFNYIHSGADQSVVAGGNANRIFNGARESFIGSGFANAIQSNSIVAFIGGGVGNTNASAYSTIGGGADNLIGTNSFWSAIAGGRNNVQEGSRDGVIGGGVFNRIFGNVAATIGGGQNNSITNGQYSTIGGGLGNDIEASATRGFIGGGSENTLRSFSFNSAIGGGFGNVVSFNAQAGTIGGGRSNVVGSYGFVGGGDVNTNNGFAATIAGGRNNNISALADHSVIGGGGDNRVLGAPILPLYGTIGGGQGNTVLTNASYATIPGGISNAASAYSFAAGNRAKAIHQGSFVWADSTNADFATTASNQFLIRASGGVGINTTNPTTALEVVGTVKAGGFMDNGSGFSGNGGALTNVNATTLGGLRSSNFWQLNGNNIAAGQFLGSTNNRAVEVRVNNQRALRLEPTAGAPNIIGGADVNAVAAGVTGATIGGGLLNTIDAQFGTIAGGNNSRIETAAIGGAIGGGQGNVIGENAISSVIAGGGANGIARDSVASVISGGGQNEIDIATDFATIGGGEGNRVADQARWSSVGGGYGNFVHFGTRYGTIGGGRENSVGSFVSNGDTATVAGGSNNLAASAGTAVGGGRQNVSFGLSATVPGGENNEAIGDYSFAAGRRAKAMHAGSFVWADSTDADFLSGGPDQFLVRTRFAGINRTGPVTGADFFSVRAPVQGGFGGMYMETEGTLAKPFYGYALGGGAQAWTYVDGSDASKWKLSVAGLDRLIVAPSGQILANGNLEVATANSLSFGAQTRQMINLWGTQYGIGVQNSAAYFRSDQEFMWYRRGSHSDAFGDPGPGGTQLMRLGINGELIIAGTLSQGSDRNIKAGFEPVDAKAILEKVTALPITRWHYTNDAATPHIGAVAQDFYGAFNVGSDDKHIAAVDADGVALAAIQGLNQKLEEQLAAKTAEIDELKRSVAELKELLLSQRR